MAPKLSVLNFTLLDEYQVEYENSSVDHIRPDEIEEIDGVEVILLL